MIESYRLAQQDTYTVVDIFAELYDAYNDLNNRFPILKVTKFYNLELIVWRFISKFEQFFCRDGR